MRRFLRNNKLARQVVFASAVIFSVWLINYYSSIAEAEPVPVTPVAVVKPENDPLLEEVDLLVWARDAAVSTYTYRADDIQGSLRNSSNYFTISGWQDFYHALKASRNLETIRTKNYTVSAKSVEIPQILERGVVDDTYSWRIQCPIEVLMHSDTGDVTQKLMITMKVRRTNNQTDRNGPGVAIEQFVAAPAQSSSIATNNTLG